MAQKIQTPFTDDIDGGEADGTVRFGLDGAEYEIDLSAAHNAGLRDALGKYVSHARKVTARGARPAGRRRPPARFRRHHCRPRLGAGQRRRYQGARPGAS